MRTFETLEPRIVLASGPLVHHPPSKQVNINGTDGNDVAIVSAIDVETVAFELQTSEMTYRIFVAADQLEKIVFRGKAGDDRFENGTQFESTAFGGAGDDDLLGGTGEDRLHGEAGNDTLRGSGGDDRMQGGRGDDILWGGRGDDLLDGDHGADHLYAEAGADNLKGGDGDDLLRGGAGDDLLQGGKNNDTMYGQAGADRILGQEGVDELFGGEGDDWMSGGTDSDVMFGGTGVDEMHGDGAADQLFGQGGADRLFGGRGYDRLEGGDDDDYLRGESGNDELLGEDGSDALFGDSGNDRLLGGRGDDKLDGGSGRDELLGQAQDDLIMGGPGKDTLSGGTGNDELFGGDEADTLRGGDGADYLRGETGDDVLYGDADADSLFGDQGDDQLLGGAGSDRLSGDEGDDQLQGGPDDDDIHAGAGDDLASGGSGADEVYGDGGHDRLEGGTGDDYLRGGTGRDAISGDTGSDTLFGEEDSDIMWGGADNDRLLGGHGADELWGGAGADELSGEAGNDSMFGNDGDDMLRGDGGDDLLRGEAGMDQLLGHDGNDVLLGGPDGDELAAGNGDDILIGGRGADELRGDLGSDLLIGGWTGYDRFDPALEQLRSTWTVDVPYEFRVAGMEHRSFAFYIASEISVHDDQTVDRLSGEDDRDWFVLTGTAEDHGHGHVLDNHAVRASAGLRKDPAPAAEGSLTPGRDLLQVLDVLEDRHADERIHTLVPHPDNAVMRRTHLSLFDLVPYTAVTHSAVANGNWSDPATWHGGHVPDTDARVLIPHGTTVTVDGPVDATLKTIRVDGTLRFDPQRTTRLIVDTLVVSRVGTLEMGTESEPVSADVESRIIIADRGPIDARWDPLALSRGVIVHGRIEMHGAETTSFAMLQNRPTAGTTELILEEVPRGWSVGDALILAATDREGRQDERLTILDLDGPRVTVAPLEFDHVPPDPDLKVHVAHVTRNVSIESESPALDRRGHVMFMHTRDVEIRYAGFYQVGRSNKVEEVNDVTLDAQGNRMPGTGLNPRGRYAVHFHRNGVHNDNHPSIVHGSAVVESPGWGYVNHSSFVHFTDNVAYDVDGAAFVTEAGDEIGSFVGNLAIRSTGSGEDVTSRNDTQDFGHQGDGFWLQGGGVEVVGNVASGHQGNAFIAFTRGLIQNGLGQTLFLAENLSDPSLADGQEKVDVGHVPLAGFRNNIAYASNIGVTTRFHLRQAEHRHRSVLEDLLLWSNRTGMDLSYTDQTVVKDSTIVAEQVGDPAGVGIDRNGGTRNITFQDLHIEGYAFGLKVPRRGDNIIDGGFFNNQDNILFNTPLQEETRVEIRGPIQFGTLPPAVTGGRPQREVVMRSILEDRDGSLDHVFASYQVQLNYGPHAGGNVLFTEQAADYVPFPEPVEEVPHEFVGRTNQQIWDTYQIAVGGAVAPPDAISDPQIKGFIVP